MLLKSFLGRSHLTHCPSWISLSTFLFPQTNRCGAKRNLPLTTVIGFAECVRAVKKKSYKRSSSAALPLLAQSPVKAITVSQGPRCSKQARYNHGLYWHDTTLCAVGFTVSALAEVDTYSRKSPLTHVFGNDRLLCVPVKFGLKIPCRMLFLDLYHVYCKMVSFSYLCSTIKHARPL